MKQKTEQRTYINKLEETINKIQTSINNFHENITKLNSDAELKKSKMFSYENISQNKKKMFKSAGLEADNFQSVF